MDAALTTALCASVLTPPRVEPAESYLTQFKWDEGKFPTSRSLRELTERLIGDVGGYDESLKKRLAEYTAVKSQLAAITRRDQYVAGGAGLLVWLTGCGAVAAGSRVLWLGWSCMNGR